MNHGRLIVTYALIDPYQIIVTTASIESKGLSVPFLHNEPRKEIVSITPSESSFYLVPVT